jgi:hypothetical protein
MRLSLGPIFLLCATFAFAQANADPEVARAKAGIEKLRALVAAGAAPRAQLEKAEDTMADAEDAALLRKTLYGQDLTEAQVDEMVAAVNRRFERRKQAFEKASKLVAAGVASQLSLGPFVEELDYARQECALAETRASLTRDLVQMARTEDDFQTKLAQEPSEASRIAERYDGDGVFTPGTFTRVETAYENRFGKPLPVSAMGETAVHRALGFDHRGRVDVALQPDAPEGVWLREYLNANHIPYFAFRHAVPGKATGAHIHLGPMSGHLVAGG